MNEILVTTQQNNYKVKIRKNWDDLQSSIGHVIKPKSKVLLITDSNVDDLYFDIVWKILSPKFNVSFITVPAGEKSKSIDVYNRCISEAINSKLDRSSSIIALGGGVIGDLAGFVASTYMRGIKFIQIPTTLLAHDSSVGGKVAINHDLGKNLIGNFHQPSLVYYNISCFKTLSDKELRSGYSELIKHSIIADEKFYTELISNTMSIRNLIEWENFAEYLIKGIEIKRDIVEKDEMEANVRAYLNLGHTLGHAIEAYDNYSNLSHGEAVAIGTLFAFHLSNSKLNSNLPIFELLEHFKMHDFPITIKPYDESKLVDYMLLDKKNDNDDITFVLPEKIGTMSIHKFSREQIIEEICNFKTSLNL